MFKAFKEHIDHRFPELRQSEFLFACSGGIDSMVLFHLFSRLDLHFNVAHCNFQLRGEESDEDEKLVEIEAVNKGVNYFVTRFDTVGYLNKNNLSLQVGARQLRYDWFSDLMTENRIEFLVTAHHADDNLETFLINLSRGSGLDGLTGIPEKTGSICRPLLPFSREQILEYAKKHSIEWREDRSNSDTKYLRNKLRHDIIPLLKSSSPAFLDNFNNSIKYLNQVFDIKEDTILHLKNKLFIEGDQFIEIDIEQLIALQPLEGYMYHLFCTYGFREPQELIQLTEGLSGKELRSKSHRLIRDRKRLLLSEIKITESPSYTINYENHEIVRPLNLKVEEVSGVGEHTKNIIYVDGDALKYPLTVRKWENGDYFHPFGLGGKKKLSKYFKDEKYNTLAKEEQWLLCSENSIVWVIGRRADERFKVTDKTKKVLKLTYSNEGN
ncbi:tRNA lysidine(34) synthetase TilS [Euzebyella marina]|uniref:tRNA(Ile)-lysidine synthase n=1 Tax=Euzebyella marina TaxID=1761453 RepID=A0A3G2L7G8_9FLAO|nr:tRNA lysidine(34) synthetase TilS [Euzebyella marina]AYN68208.1 tRNA lysidine(34) synthetase TilS [Euzebyella marina]